MVADHGMNAKTDPNGNPNVRYLSDALADAGCVARVILPITDPYIAHHGALGSIAFVYAAPDALPYARASLAALPGVEAVLDRHAAALAFELPEDRIGDLVICADAQTALGKRRAHHDLSALPGALRSHGGLHEQQVPLVICHGLPQHALISPRLRNADLFALLLESEPDIHDAAAANFSPRQAADPACPICAAVLDESSGAVIDCDEQTVTLMHTEPATDGHVLVVPRRHATDLYDITPDDLSATIRAAQRVAFKLRDRLGADGINLVNACRPAAWQTVFHFHLHVVPRYGNDRLIPPWTPRPGDHERLQALAALLRHQPRRSAR